MMYLHLLHGRENPGVPMNEMGDAGPIFGPIDWVHVTYMSFLRFGNYDADGECELVIRDGDIVYYDGMYYGDWEVQNNTDKQIREGWFKARHEKWDRAKSIERREHGDRTVAGRRRKKGS